MSQITITFTSAITNKFFWFDFDITSPTTPSSLHTVAQSTREVSQRNVKKKCRQWCTAVFGAAEAGDFFSGARAGAGAAKNKMVPGPKEVQVKQNYQTWNRCIILRAHYDMKRISESWFEPDLSHLGCPETKPKHKQCRILRPRTPAAAFLHFVLALLQHLSLLANTAKVPSTFTNVATCHLILLKSDLRTFGAPFCAADTPFSWK